MLSVQIEEIWQNALATIKKEVNPATFETWFATSHPLTFDARQHLLRVGVPDAFTRQWLTDRYQDLIKEALAYVAGIPVNVEFVLPNETNPDPLIPTTRVPILNPRYTFDTFVVGNSNRFAHAAALAVADGPGRAYNPLFIYGGVGLGKTHLMQAIAHRVIKTNTLPYVFYVSSEQFTNELITAIREDRTGEFRRKYRNVDLLLIDDIQFLAGKERTQEEFFHTFNALYEANHQIVISSDRQPKEIPTLESRLRSRFEWGLITDIQPPDFETRVAILEKKAAGENMCLNDQVLSYIAQHISSNIRELEGALVRLIAYARTQQQAVTMELAVEALQEILPAAQPQPVTIARIQEIVAKQFGLRVEELKAKKRNRSVAYPRQIAMYLCRELTEASLPHIGQEFGGRDHTTVIHACEKIADNIQNDVILHQTINHIKEALTI